MTSFVYDLAQLIHQLKLAPVTLVSHSLGGNIALRYTGLYPDSVRRLVAIEGLGPSPEMMAERLAKSIDQRIREWIDTKRAAAGRVHKRYQSLDEAYTRMKTENSYLSDAQARHLTQHGISQNEDGTWSWKFDNYVRFMNPVDLPESDIHGLWHAISCPTLLLYGADSWASNPQQDGRARHFRNARVEVYENAGHWLHHDQTERFVRDIKAFL
jgi:pimeloyl-ACP methyl ester carboxylesterase